MTHPIHRPERSAVARYGLLLVIVLAAVALRSAGIDWPHLNPDEHQIAAWLDYTTDHSFVKDRVYPNGFFELARPARYLALRWHDLSNHLAYRTGQADAIPPPMLDQILFGRWLNVVLAALTCLILFFLGKRVTGSAMGGFIAAALLAFHPYHVQHSHYAETDVAMVFTLTVALWLWAVVSDRRHTWLFMLASLATGFATGTKFILVVLLPLVIVYVFLCARGKSRPVARGALYVLGGILLFALGFVLANPGVTHWKWFILSARHEALRVYSETRGLGPGDPREIYAGRVHDLAEGVLSLGYVWITLLIVSIPCLFTRRARRFWPVTVLFPALYLFYCAEEAPWIRPQEFMNFLPVLGIAAALPLVLLWHARVRKPARPILRTCALLLSLAMVGFVAEESISIASLFGWQDTRLLAQTWLDLHGPGNRTAGVEIYTNPAFEKTFAHIVEIEKIERCGIDFPLAKNCDYMLRNATMGGRGLWDARTGRRYPEFQEFYDDAMRRSELLKIWAPLPPTVGTFAGPEIQLYGLRHFTNSVDLDIDLPQPLFLAQSGRPTFFEVGHRLGSAQGLEINRHPQIFAVGGPNALTNTLYVILNTEVRPADVRIDGFGKRRWVKLDPFDVRIVPLRRTGSFMTWKKYEVVKVRAKPVQHIGLIPCFLRVAFTPEEAVRICRELGRPDRALELAESLPKLRDDAGLYPLAVETEQWALADRLESEARKTYETLVKTIEANPSTYRIHGTSGFYYDEFSSLRLYSNHEAKIHPAGGFVPAGVHAAYPRADETGRTDRATAEIALPVRLPQGRYEVRGLVAAEADRVSESSAGTFQLLDDAGAVLISDSLSNVLSRSWISFSASHDVSHEKTPVLVVDSSKPITLYFKEIEIDWTVQSGLEASRRDLATALARHQAHRGNVDEALSLLKALPEKSSDARALIFECRGRKQSAKELLEVSPQHYEAIRLLAESDPKYAAPAESMKSNLEKPLVFPPLVALVGFSTDPASRRLHGVFEILRDNTPPLDLVLLKKKRGSWREFQKIPLGETRIRNRGERAFVDVQVDSGSLDPARLAFWIQTSTPWQPGILPIAGSKDQQVPFVSIQPQDP
jgi:4-amino-4-deoxy-L-arabinose transferase-like glycosyltransferase